MRSIQASIDALVSNIEQIHNAPLEEEQVSQIDAWSRGKALAEIQNYPGWDVVRQMLESYYGQAIKDLASTPPESKEAVIARHAHAYAVRKTVTDFFDDVSRLIADSKETPEIVKEPLRMFPNPTEKI